MTDTTTTKPVIGPDGALAPLAEARSAWALLIDQKGGFLAASRAESYDLLTRGFTQAMAMHLPNHMQGGLLRYVLLGIPSGDFLTAVMEHDLATAARRADQGNLRALGAWGLFLFDFVPIGARGSKEDREWWISVQGRLGIEAGLGND
jgi:hypothetical protein